MLKQWIDACFPFLFYNIDSIICFPDISNVSINNIYL